MSSRSEPEQKRVKFDFEVTFSNGGALQAQDFRLDIDSDTISDAALADYVEQDLRLLMVERIRILNKQIIAEKHKRTQSATTRAGTVDFVDLSQTVEDGMITYPGLPPPVITDHLTREASREIYAPGTEFSIRSISMVANTGTYLDTPAHRYESGTDVADLALARVANVVGVVVRASSVRAVTSQHFSGIDVTGKAVLVQTGWDRHWRTDTYHVDSPHLTAEAAVHLIEHGAVAVGIDSLNIDDTRDRIRPVHSALLKAGIPIIEHLCNLSSLPDRGFRFFAVPVKVRTMGSFPVRAFAVIDESRSN